MASDCIRSGGSEIKYNQQLYIHFVRDAVYAFAHALHALHNASCLNFDDQRLCPNFKKKVFTELHSYLRQVEFKDVDNKTFHFSGQAQHKHKHDGPPRYSIINFQKITSSKEVIRRRLSIKGRAITASCFCHIWQIANKSTYDWQNVGTYHQARITEMDKEFKQEFQQFPNFQNDGKWRRCTRKKCLPHQVLTVLTLKNSTYVGTWYDFGRATDTKYEPYFMQVKVPDTLDQCCWHCITCEVHERKKSEFECEACPKGQWSQDPLGTENNHSKCYDLPESSLDYTRNWSIASMR